MSAGCGCSSGGDSLRRYFGGTPDGITLFVSAQSVVIPRGQEELVQALQRAYAHQILDTVASQFGWTLESTDTSESNFVLSKF